MARLYRQHVLKEQATIQIQGLRAPRSAETLEPAGTAAPKSHEPQPVLHKPTV
jgi:hypothetical protein